MESQLFQILYALLLTLSNLHPRRRGQIYSDAHIVAVLLWSALWGRPICWACRLENWQGHCPLLALPSEGTMSRRRRSLGVQLLLAQWLDALNAALPESLVKRLDARPLVVGGASKDCDARCGFGAGKLAKGYKLHEIRSGRAHLHAWTLTAMADREPTVAPQLIAQLTGTGYLIGDNAFDINDLYADARAVNHQLVAPPRPSAAGLGHQPHDPARLRGLALLANPLACCGVTDTFGQGLLNARRAIEADFGHETLGPSYLGALPPFVRRPHRVVGWVACKLGIGLAWAQIRHLQAA